jgi:hypothetical protein
VARGSEVKLVRDLSRLNAWFCIAVIASYFVSSFDLPAILLIPIYYAPIGVVATVVLALSGVVAVLTCVLQKVDPTPAREALRWDILSILAFAACAGAMSAGIAPPLTV